MGYRLVGAGLALALLAACSQGERQDQADRIRHSLPTDRSHFIVGSFTLDIAVAHVDAQRQFAGRSGGRLVAVEFAALPGARRSAMFTKADQPIFVGSGRSLYARRITKSVHERRPWVRVDFDHLNDTNKPKLRELTEAVGPGDAALVTPQLVLDLLSGALTGSVRKGATDAEGATEYQFNVSIDKASRTLRLSDDQRDDRAKVLRALAITDDIHTATAVIARNGTLARLVVKLTEQPDKQAKLALRATLVTTNAGKADASVLRTLKVPARDTTIRVASLGDIRSAVTDQLHLLAPAVPSPAAGA